ncbi:MAG: beta-N-acetylhexosaminidase [Acidobacteriota bacterium]|nr:beta-N-acetylhexosaminidase [Acidobacteriota bacterium]
MRNILTRTLILRLAILCVTGLLAVQVAAQEAAATSKVHVIPQPRQMALLPDEFHLGPGTTVSLADPRSEADRFAAEDFVADVKTTTGVMLKIDKARTPSILIGTVEQAAVQAALKRADLIDSADLDAEGYLISVSEKKVVVAGKTATGVFYGLQTLKQLVRGQSGLTFIQGVKITDWPAMRWRGVSDDISRGPVPTVEYIKRQLRTEAMFKLNMHSFYMEHTFGSLSNPLIAPAGGSLTVDEIRDLVIYARRYHIELVPEQQTFGHLHKALRLEKYGYLAEAPQGDVISPQQEGSYKLIADWYRELNEFFPGKFFHIGADETFELGDGQSREAARTRGVGAVYFEHLNRVREVLKPYNRRLMFWGDIALNHPDLIGSIPKDMIVMNWQYAARDDYGTYIKPFKDAGLDQFVCPGAWNWNQIFPNVDVSSRNIVNFVRDGQKAGAIGMMNTSWDDDGESLFEMTWYGIVLGAAASWQSNVVDQPTFDRDFDWAFFRNDGEQFTKAIRALGSVSAGLGLNITSDELFWRDPFTTPFQNLARANAEKIHQLRLTVENAQESLLQNQTRAQRNRSMIPALLFAAQRFDHLGHRMQLVVRFSDQYWDAYLNLGDRDKARKLRYYYGLIYNNLREMAEELSLLKEGYRTQWLAENRPYWLESVLARYDQAIAMWLAKSRETDEAFRHYNATSTLPSPEEFGLGPRPTPTPR